MTGIGTDRDAAVAAAGHSRARCENRRRALFPNRGHAVDDMTLLPRFPLPPRLDAPVRRCAGVARRRSLARGAASLGIAFLCATAPEPGYPVEPLQQHDIVLLQPGTVIERRVDGGADAMADYLRRLGVAAADALRANPQQIPSAGFIVVALRPAGQVHAWFDFKPALAAATTSALTAAVASVPPVPVKESDVVFALRVSVWGARPPAGYAPAPQEWKDAARLAGHKLDIDSLVDAVWPPP